MDGLFYQFVFIYWCNKVNKIIAGKRIEKGGMINQKKMIINVVIKICLIWKRKIEERMMRDLETAKMKIEKTERKIKNGQIQLVKIAVEIERRM